MTSLENTDTNADVVRWGFLGAAQIARKNWKAIRLGGNGRVAAVASRSRSRASDFIAQCAAEVPMPGPVEAFGDYEALIRSDAVDAVYIPLPTGVRKRWVIAAAEAGKHVLCEKPVAVNAADCREMIDACAASNVQFMDGVMFDHGGRLPELTAAVARPETIGMLRRVQTHFSFLGGDDFADANIRADARLEPHGCLGDLGWYCIRFILRMVGDAMPHRVAAHAIRAFDGPDGRSVPAEMTGELEFPAGVTAGFFCSFLTTNQQTAMVSGTDGYLAVDDFVLPFYNAEVQWTENRHVLAIDNCRWNFRRHSQRRGITEYASGEPNSQEVHMVRRFAELAAAGTPDPQFPDVALRTQRILDACRRSDAGGGGWVAIE